MCDGTDDRMSVQWVKEKLGPVLLNISEAAELLRTSDERVMEERFSRELTGHQRPERVTGSTFDGLMAQAASTTGKRSRFGRRGT